MAAGLASRWTGLPVTFAVGSASRAWRGAGADIPGLDPSFPPKFMVYFLIVCAVGGTSSITGPLVAALLLGIADVMGKYYVPKLSSFIVYLLMIGLLLWRPAGPVLARGRAMSGVQQALRAGALARVGDRGLGAAGAAPFVFASHAALINEIAILALFALSLT